MARDWIKSHWKLALGLTAVAGVLLLVAFAHLTGLATVERHRGYFAPVWHPDGRHVYVIERDTMGAVWGLGWEFFSPPAFSFVWSDRVSLLRHDSTTGATDRLERFHGSPVTGRITRHYRGRIFNTMSARLEPADDSVGFLIAMNVPRVPTSESWRLTGTWRSGRPSGADWTPDWAGNTAATDAVLQDGLELMTVPGQESFPAAVLAVRADGGYQVLLRNAQFDDLYPDGVPSDRIAERSQRARIERSREINRVRTALIETYLDQGLNEGAASLRAHDDMEDLGYYPKSPRLIATAVTDVAPDVRVFDISEDRFRVGLFQDIAAAIAEPGAEVKTDTGTYLKYHDDETGPALRAWRADGHDRFAVRTNGRLFVLEVRRFDRADDTP